MVCVGGGGGGGGSGAGRDEREGGGGWSSHVVGLLSFVIRSKAKKPRDRGYCKMVKCFDTNFLCGYTVGMVVAIIAAVPAAAAAAPAATDVVVVAVVAVESPATSTIRTAITAAVVKTGRSRSDNSISRTAADVAVVSAAALVVVVL